MRFASLLLATALIAPAAQAAVIGGPLLREGIEVIPSTRTDAALDRMTGGANHDALFLVADIHADKGEPHGFAEHAFIPYLSVSYVLTKDGAPTFKKSGLMFPVAAKGGPHYAASADMQGQGVYHLTYLISPPSSHGMMRQTDKAGGVPDWWKPITADWTFTYTGQTK